MINKQWTRAGVGICTATALIVGAGIAFAPAANAATPNNQTMVSNGLLDGTLTTVGGIVNGVLTPNPTATSPITITPTTGGLTVGVGSTTVGVGTGNGLSVGVTGTGGTSIGVNLGTSSTGTSVSTNTNTGTGVNTNTNTGTNTSTNTSTNTNTNTGTNTSTGTDTSTGSDTGTGTSTPIMLTALSATSAYQTVYPAKDGYRDSVAFQLKGTVSDGQQHNASGTATLSFGSKTVTSWPITATYDVITWDGRNGGKIVPGRYVLTAVIGDTSGAAVTGTESVDVSAKKLKSTTSTYSTKSVTGKHTMAAKPRAALSKAKVTLKVLSKVSGIKGKQYLVFKHGTKKLKVLIKNGTHTSKTVTIPKAFTTYTTSHTWKKGVKIKSLKFEYTYKALK